MAAKSRLIAGPGAVILTPDRLEGYNIMSNLARTDLAELRRLLDQLHESNRGRESYHTPPHHLLSDGWAEELADREFRSRAPRLMIGSSCPFGTIDDGRSPTGPFGTPPVTHCTGCARPYRAGTLTLTPAGGAVSPFCPDCL